MAEEKKTPPPGKLESTKAQQIREAHDAVKGLLAQDQEKKEYFHSLRFVEELTKHLQVEIARTRLTLRNILAWKEGMIVPFPKVVGEPLELFLDDRLIARGEVVIVNNHYGLRITEITRPEDQILDVKK